MKKRKHISTKCFLHQCAGFFVLIMMVVLAGCPQPVEELEQKEKVSISQPEKDGKKDGEATPSNNDTVPGEVTHIGLPIPKSLSKTRIPLKTTGSVLSDTENEKKVKYTIEAALYENFLLNPEKAVVIYPGAVLAGDSIDDGTYREISQGNKRSALFSFSLQGVKGKGGKSGKVSDSFAANVSRYRDFHNEVLSQKIDYTASMSSSYNEFAITSEEDFNVKCQLGVGFGSSMLKTQLSDGMSFNPENNKKHHLIRFVETFYTVDMNSGNKPFMTDIPKKVLGSTMPVYVSSVTYGRVAYLLIETEKEWADIQPALDLALKIKKHSVDAEVSAAIKKLENTTKTTIFTIGGGKDAPTTLSAFSKSIAKGGFSSGNPGQVIKYKLKFLGDNSFAYIRYGGAYTVTEKKQPASDDTSSENEDVAGAITYAGLPIPDSLSKTRIPLRTTSSVLSDTENEKKVKYDIEAALYENFLLNPEKASVLYPGAVLVGDSIDDGTYREISQGNKRSALFSFSLQGVKGKGGKPGKVSDSFAANLSRYRDFHNEVLSQKIDYTASMSSSYDEFSITSEDDFDVKCKLGVGFGISKLKAKLSAGLSFETGDDKYFHLIRFVETFYTVDMDPGSEPLMTDIPHSILGATMPVYVSSVTYGRIAYLLIESEKKWEELKPSFDMALKVKKQGVDAEVSAAIKKLEEVTKTTIFTIGGGENSPTKLSEFSKSIAKGGFSSGNPGQVIKYKLKFLDDDSFAYIRYAGTYTVTEKKPVTPNDTTGENGNGGAGSEDNSGDTTGENGNGGTGGEDNSGDTTGENGNGGTGGEDNSGDTTGENGNGGTGGEDNSGDTTGESGNGGTGGEDNSGTSEQVSQKYRISAQLKLINAKLTGFGSTSNISGSIDMSSVSDTGQKVQVFNQSASDQVAVNCEGETFVQNAAVALTVSDTSNALSFNFDITRKVGFFSYAFVTSVTGDDNEPITCTVSTLETEKKHRFKLYQKNDPNQYLEFEIEFTVKKVD